jgi:transposase
MMLPTAVRAHVCVEAVDMRRSIDGLAQLVEPLFSTNPFCGHVFVFLGKSRNKIKLLWWDSNGFIVLYKRLERGVFPKPAEWTRRGLTMAELTALLAGLDLSRLPPAIAVPASRVA